MLIQVISGGISQTAIRHGCGVVLAATIGPDVIRARVPLARAVRVIDVIHQSVRKRQMRSVISWQIRNLRRKLFILLTMVLECGQFAVIDSRNLSKLVAPLYVSCV